MPVLGCQSCASTVIQSSPLIDNQRLDSIFCMGYKHETICGVMSRTKGGLPMKRPETFDITEKARIYHTMAQLTTSFSSIIRYCDDLERAGVLTAKYRHLFQAFTVELQGQINLEILEEMDSIEMSDSARGSRVREK